MQLQNEFHLHTSRWLYTTGSLVTIGPSYTATATNIDNDEESVISVICDYEPIGLTYVLATNLHIFFYVIYVSINFH